MSSSDRTRYAVINAATGAIVRIGECDIDDLALQVEAGQDIEAPIPEGVDDAADFWNGTAFQRLPPRPGPWAAWDGSEWIDPRTAEDLAAIVAGLWAGLRAERDRLLRLCDWTEMPSAQARLSADQLTAWQAYRAALFDLPENTTNPADPAWPVQPEN